MIFRYSTTAPRESVSSLVGFSKHCKASTAPVQFAGACAMGLRGERVYGRQGPSGSCLLAVYLADAVELPNCSDHKFSFTEEQVSYPDHVPGW